ncbi:nitrite reductase large subunit NirB [Bacillus sp. FJAT-44742]|uniref:nitrite reductase large subunit NirB n=1 Tax=Bacillus sp. FJAT-44742 TaxID=2014005 RepID=UPI000C23F792|nr:nitrite reductase large subunit NirB [Bacillus sp. FJAT-44742]
MGKNKLVLVGNGMAGLHCIEELLKIDNEKYEITIFGSEPHINYNRIMLSSLLQGSSTVEEITLNDWQWYQDNNITLYTGEKVLQIDSENRMIVTDKGREVDYDRLILATGSVPFILPLPGVEKEGIISFRTIEDCEQMIKASKTVNKAVVIGGGLLGLEAAKGLLNRGMEVAVVHRDDYLMNNQLDRMAGEMLQRELESQGMKFYLSRNTKEFLGEDHVTGLQFENGEMIEADLVVMAAGVKPNIELANASGIDTNRAILVNDYLETNTPNIYAVGECAEHRSRTYGLVKPLYEQGKVLAGNLCEQQSDGYKGSVVSTQLKIAGVDVFSAGQITEDTETTTLQMYDGLENIYKKIFFKDEIIVGAVLYGDISMGSKLLGMMLQKKELSDKDKKTFLQNASGGTSPVASMEQTELICNCNNVSKGTIIEKVQENNCTTLGEVKECTKASTSCGSCQPFVADLLEYIQSDDFNEKIERKTMCSCTSLTEEQVVQQIQVKNLRSVQGVIESLPWDSKDGCADCVPALHYYLGMIDENYQAQRTFSEEEHAVKQQNGTYTITPKIYGGLTNPQQLRLLADLAEAYNLHEVAIGEDQRLHIQGVRESDLASIYEKLNKELIPSGAYKINPVQTSHSPHVCDCEKEQGTKLAVEIERQLEYLNTPSTVKVSVSSCMKDCAGAKLQDIGLVPMNRGWEVYIGGTTKGEPQTGELLSVAETSEDAMILTLSLIQYYRETGNFRETVGEWAQRITEIHLREVLFDSELQDHLLERLDHDRNVRMEKKYGLEVTS